MASARRHRCPRRIPLIVAGPTPSYDGVRRARLRRHGPTTGSGPSVARAPFGDRRLHVLEVRSSPGPRRRRSSRRRRECMRSEPAEVLGNTSSVFSLAHGGPGGEAPRGRARFLEEVQRSGGKTPDGNRERSARRFDRWWRTGPTDSTGERTSGTSTQLPQFKADVRGLGIHFVHRRAARGPGLPILLVNGWPSTFVEELPLVPLLTDPQAHGIAGPAFDVVIPSLPGYGFSDRSPRAGVTPGRRPRCSSS